MPQASPDLTDIEPIGEDDRACLEEVRATLARHGRLDRFGLTLLHDHFPLKDNELLVETCDPEALSLYDLPGGHRWAVPLGVPSRRDNLVVISGRRRCRRARLQERLFRRSQRQAQALSHRFNG